MSETLWETVGKVEFDVEMKAIGMAVLKELARQNFRIAELEVDNAKLKKNNEHMLGCIFEYETIAPDGQLGVSLLNMDNHIRSLEADNQELRRKLAFANKRQAEMEQRITSLLARAETAERNQVAAELIMKKFCTRMDELEADKKRAEQMVGRLIEAGRMIGSAFPLLRITQTDIDTWDALVAEWQENQRGDSNV